MMRLEDVLSEDKIPATEVERQYYFIDVAKQILEDKEKEAGRKLTFCVNTFGCQMNARDSEKLIGILESLAQGRGTGANPFHANPLGESSYKRYKITYIYR